MMSLTSYHRYVFLCSDVALIAQVCRECVASFPGFPPGTSLDRRWKSSPSGNEAIECVSIIVVLPIWERGYRSVGIDALQRLQVKTMLFPSLVFHDLLHGDTTDKSMFFFQPYYCLHYL